MAAAAPYHAHEAVEAWLAERAAYRAVVRWNALYNRCRKRMMQMDERAARRLHEKLKGCQYAADEYYDACRHRLHALGIYVEGRA